jgi:hypothetical protein
MPACKATKVTLAPTDDGALSENRYPAIGTMLVPTVANWFDDRRGARSICHTDKNGLEGQARRLFDSPGA